MRPMWGAQASLFGGQENMLNVEMGAYNRLFPGRSGDLSPSTVARPRAYADWYKPGQFTTADEELDSVTGAQQPYGFRPLDWLSNQFGRGANAVSRFGKYLTYK
jgi:hypothetical protein